LSHECAPTVSPVEKTGDTVHVRTRYVGVRWIPVRARSASGALVARDLGISGFRITAFQNSRFSWKWLAA